MKFTESRRNYKKKFNGIFQIQAKNRRLIKIPGKVIEKEHDLGTVDL